MKKIWLVVMGVVLVLAVVAGLAGCSSQGTFLNTQQQTGIWVSGNGKVTAVPDVATLSLGIEAQAVTVAEAQSQAAEAMGKVMTALKGNGVAEKDIQTQNFNIQKVTRWDNDKQQETLIGYRVTNTVTAKIRSLPQESFTLDYKAGMVIDAVTAAGGDLARINSIGFTVDDPTAYYAQARQKAIVDAAAKAKQMADLTGVKLGKMTYISESSYIPGPIYRDVMTNAGGVPAPTTPISTGEMDITDSVQIAYAID